MSYLRRFGRFWWEFVVGDDVWLAAGAGAALGVTAVLVHVAGLNPWWLLPLVIVALLAAAVLREAG